MSIRIGINGFGRIGRYLARLLANEKGYELAVVNARADNGQLAHLLKYDSIHGTFDGEVEDNEKGFLVDGKQVVVTRDAPGEWSWGDWDVDIVVESTGAFRDRVSCEQMIACGCEKVVISAPGSDCDATIVMGVNDHLLKAEDNIISNASCTTNCLAPVAKVLHESFGIERGLMTTIHSYTMSQRVLDGTHKDLRRGRAGAVNMLPTTTGAARSVTEVIPELKGKLDGMAVRVPTPNVSLVDFVADVKNDVTIEKVNAALKAASKSELRSIMGYTEIPLASTDYIGSTYGGVVDGLCTAVMADRMVKCIIWYDNESSFTNQLLRLIRKVGAFL
ncbi:type I glyceraldehyde-3-phosphate dehydrogenase [Maridesulfovibrio hydrothermalis]|uniref:Glyceraldehyde-3-phosphate dehydrogenase n=1 Tax=Maridesulfovibrio hydrothermalis AM13 = DSM 14728 TaxID=1121451 RepID=L0RHZ6_9BACT|nr:type I glyceraldehyde-3-phosphate dehydrogenase [Maridesulfovibrio hydrothermalis]CCO25221.1 glyceraldehyde-3-phosphate dehydrogenase [Maridesulfovibrio hydrothermalis AM13 = DSM 14728]